MPYYLDGRAIANNRPFTHEGLQYPANWIQFSTEEERTAIGMTFVDEARNWDRQFYSGYDPDGNLIPLDHGRLVALWTAKTREAAGNLLRASDWMVVRKADNGAAIPAAWSTWRESIRTTSDGFVDAIAATTTTDELRAYIRGDSYGVYALDPDQAAAEPAATEESE